MLFQTPTMDPRDLDPNCAICSQPAQIQCDCERKGLELAVRQAEQRIMTSLYEDIRQWVRGRAQDYILAYFQTLSTRRREAHTAHIHALQTHYAHFYTQPHPSEISNSEAMLKKAIDADWAASVQRYPEVLEYFFSLVEVKLPGEDDARVVDPPLSALCGVARGKRLLVEAPSATGKERERGEERRGRRRSGFVGGGYLAYPH